jgi:hypothetical protein
MSTVVDTQTEAEHCLRSGDVLVYINRPSPAKTALQILRSNQPLMWKTSVGEFPGYSLGVRYDIKQCIAHARAKAAESGLIAGQPTEIGGELHVRVV